MTNTTVPFKNCQVIDCLHTGSKTLVYRAKRISDGQLVILKLLRSEYPTFNELLQFRNQYTIAKNLKIRGIVHPDSLDCHGNSYILIMEDFGGISLQQYAQDNELSVTEILNIALQLAEILHDLHQARVIHKDIKPANILIHPQSKQVKLIDFSIATLLPKETQTIQNPNVLEGTLAYIAPEQTGRMNRGIDYRADFYSLGITLYELLARELPFKGDDPMELIHCHIARIPSVLGNRQWAIGNSEEIPGVVSNIVMKLIAKNAEDRYQSALGLKFDLEQCLIQWKEKEEIVEFELGQRDFSDRFNIPEKLYGREAEVQTLLDAFNRISAQKPEKQYKEKIKTDTQLSELMLVSGFSGIGKTAIVNEVHKPITRSSGFFIKGKFDQFNRNIPLSALVQALRDLMGQLLCESDSQLQEWKAKILAAVGVQGQVLIEVIPELESIIGPQPTAAELSATAAQNRFNLLFHKFIEVFTTAQHPLVIFLDDLQWADLASLQLIQLLMNDSHYLLILGAYRDNEVSPTHPLILTLEELKKAQKTVNTITLKPLSFQDMNHLVADTLNCSTPLAQPLTELIYRKTQGNPFFTTQFLKGLHEDGYIRFKLVQSPLNRREIAGGWECDIAEVNALALTDDVVEFMALQLQKLPPQTQQVLKLAACIGNVFDLNTLAIVSQQSPIEAATALWKALQDGLILPITQVYKFFQEAQPSDVEDSVNAKYRFLHDRVQQAAYSLIPDNQKQKYHYHIGQLLLQNTPLEAREEQIFALVNQLNYGITLIRQQPERDQLAQLNLMACRKARSATAYQAGYEYAQIGLSLLAEAAWQKQYELTLEFHNLAAELASLCGDFEAMEQWVETVISQAHTLNGSLGLQVASKLNAKASKPEVLMILGLFLLHRNSHTKETLPLLQEGYTLALEVGELVFAGYSGHSFCLNAFWSGQPLAILEQETRAYSQGLEQLNQLTTANYCRIYWQPLLNLLGCSDNPTVLSGEAMQETELLSQLQSSNDGYGLYIFYLYKMMLCYLFGDIEQAELYALEVRRYFIAGQGLVIEAVFYFYDSLIALAKLNQNTTETSEILERVEQNQTQLQRYWAHYAPMNYQHKYDLVEAEKYRALGQYYQAGDWYEIAIAHAQENRYIQEEALANELAAQCYLSWGREKIAQTYLIEAYYCYARWGAKAKIVWLEQQYPQLLAPILRQQHGRFDLFQTFTKTSNQTYQASSSSNSGLLDFTSVMKASFALSGEIELEKLVTKLMQVILENAGATKGVLIFNRNTILTVKAIANHSSELGKNIRIIPDSLPVENCLEVPLKVVNRVKRQLKPIVISQEFDQSQWLSDAYFLTHSPQSLLCLPILNHGKLIGIVYLENHLTTQALTPDRVEVLKLLCSQAAISLENAEFYQKSQDYSHQLEQSLTQLKAAQVQLVQSEKMSALGQMMAGITHEINNPLGFVSGNINQVEESLQELLDYLQLYQQYHPPGAEMTAYAEEAELDYLLEDVPQMIHSMKIGVKRIQDISQSMRIFSRLDQDQKVNFDVHEGIDSTLLILKHRLKANNNRPAIQVVKDYGKLPDIIGFPGQLNQVFMNILANAVDVFDEMNEAGVTAEMNQSLYQITVKTELDRTSQTVKISILDNGCGMPNGVKAKIFDHLFTTKAVGKGTGLGLSIAHQIVVDKQGGKLDCDSTVGVGTKFVIQLPV